MEKDTEKVLIKPNFDIFKKYGRKRTVESLPNYITSSLYKRVAIINKTAKAHNIIATVDDLSYLVLIIQQTLERETYWCSKENVLEKRTGHNSRVKDHRNISKFLTSIKSGLSNDGLLGEIYNRESSFEIEEIIIVPKNKRKEKFHLESNPLLLDIHLKLIEFYKANKGITIRKLRDPGLQTVKSLAKFIDVFFKNEVNIEKASVDWIHHVIAELFKAGGVTFNEIDNPTNYIASKIYKSKRKVTSIFLP